MESNAGGPPQFNTAEYSAKSGGDLCRTCGRSISGAYYRVNGVMTCSSCSQKAEQTHPKDTHGTFVRGITFGVGGAVLGLILYAAFGIFTGLVIGYISLAVGYIVGKAVKFGSNGIGGRRYQIAAALLTYSAVSMAAIPIGISQYVKAHPPKSVSQQAAPMNETQTLQNSRPEEGKSVNWGKALVGLAFLGLASPFLDFQDPIHGVIGLIILTVGIRIAWQMTAGKSMEIIGPFQSSSQSPAQDQAAIE